MGLEPADPPMQMRAGGPAGLADGADLRALGHEFPVPHRDRVHVDIDRVQAQAVVDMLGGAMQNCRDKDELVELSTVRAMAVAQLAAARDVGLTSFQM